VRRCDGSISAGTIIGPDDLAVCQRVFDQICAGAKIDRNSDEGEVLAVTVVTFFQHGFAEYDDLLAAVLGYRDEVSRKWL
jgi:hypothetical protein